MYILLFILIFYMEELLAAAPDWVQGVRSGEERFKLPGNNYTLFRQIAQDCETAIRNVESDLEREYNRLVKYTTEVIYEDELGCAITVSVSRNPETRQLSIKNYMLKRAQMAQKHAVYGLTYVDFKRFTNDSSPILNNPASWCLKAANTAFESVHGIVTICWKDEVIQAHCVPKAGACWRNAP